MNCNSTELLCWFTCFFDDNKFYLNINFYKFLMGLLQSIYYFSHISTLYKILIVNQTMRHVILYFQFDSPNCSGFCQEGKTFYYIKNFRWI